MATKAAVPAGNTPLELHPLVYHVPGEMNDEEFGALCASIKAQGQRRPIILLDGKILDGRHRYKACVKLGIAPKVREFNKDDGDPTEFVEMENLHRRQLNSMQKALVAARRYLLPGQTATQEQLAVLVGVGKNTLNLAVRLLNSKNTPLIKRTERGDASRAEIDEVLYDRESASAQAPTQAHVPDDDDDDDEPTEVDPLDTTGAPASVAGTTGEKPAHPERRAVETGPSRLAQAFGKLSAVDQSAFISIAWHKLQPALIKAGKLPNLVDTEGKTVEVKVTKEPKPKLDPVANRKPAKKKAVKKGGK